MTTTLTRDTGVSSSEATELHWWRGRPVLAALVRLAVFAAPIAASFLASFLIASRWPRPDGFWPVVGWWLTLVLVGSLALALTNRVARRFLPLSMLLRMTLVFPDERPSRFSVALRTGTTRQLERQISDLRDGGGIDDRGAAETLLRLVAALRAHDRFTRGHGERVRAYAALIGDELGLDDIERSKLQWAGLIHDIGKLEVPDEILNKEGSLTAAEYEIVKRHPEAGMQIAAPLADWLGDWVNAVGEHHERWDGSGYPSGRAGTDISLAGRIVAVADVFDVITATRSYKRAQSPHDAREELARHAGTQFDPDIVRAFLQISIGRLRAAMWPLSWLAHIPYLGTSVTAPATSILAPAVFAASATLAGGSVATANEVVDAIPVFDRSGANAEVVGSTTTTTTPASTTTRPGRSGLPVPPSAIDTGPVPTTEPGADSTTSTTTTTATTEPADRTTTTIDDDDGAVPVDTEAVATTIVATATTTTIVATTTTTASTTTTAASTTTTSTTTTPPATACDQLAAGVDDLSGADLRGCSVSGLSIDGVDLSFADLDGADLSDLTLSNFNLWGANLGNANLAGAQFSDGSLSGVTAASIDARGARFARVDFGGATLIEARFDNARLIDVSFGGADLTDADASGAVATGTNFNGARLVRIDLSDATLASLEFFNADVTDGNLENANLRLTRLDDADLTGARLVDADLGQSVIERVALATADLTRADFTAATGVPTGAASATHAATVCPNGTTSGANCWP